MKQYTLQMLLMLSSTLLPNYFSCFRALSLLQFTLEFTSEIGAHIGWIFVLYYIERLRHLCSFIVSFN